MVPAGSKISLAKNESMEIKIPTDRAGIKTMRYESPDESMTRISLDELSLPTVIRVPIREANGADMAMTEGSPKRTSSATWYKGTRFARISPAIRSKWLTKKTKKKNRKDTKKEKRISFTRYLNKVQEIALFIESGDGGIGATAMCDFQLVRVSRLISLIISRWNQNLQLPVPFPKAHPLQAP